MEKMNNYIVSCKKHIALLLAVTLMFGALLPGTTANAQENELEDITVNELTLEASLTVREQFKEDLDNGNFTIHALIDWLSLEDAVVFEILDGDQIFKSMMIPIVDDSFNLLSNLTIHYDVDLGVLSYTETHVLMSNYETFKIVSFSNGVPFAEEITDIEHVTNEEFQQGIDELRMMDEMMSNPRTRNVWCVIGQLGLAGIAAATAAAICGVPCKLKPTACKTCFTVTMGFFGVSAHSINRCFR